MVERRGFIKTLAFGAVSVWFPKLPKAAGKDDRPNIVIIIADDLGWNDVSYHGGPIPTPNIDRFVSEGVELDRFYVCPVCTPTRAGVLTGRYPIRYGLPGHIMFSQTKGLPPSEFTLPEMLEQAGYKHRMALGKWHLGTSTTHFHPLNHFSGFYGHYCGAIDYFTHDRGGEKDWHRDYESVDVEGYSTDIVTDEAVKFIGTHAADGERFFLHVAYNAVHTPIQAKEDDIAAAGKAYQAGVKRHGSSVQSPKKALQPKEKAKGKTTKSTDVKKEQE